MSCNKLPEDLSTLIGRYVRVNISVNESKSVPSIRAGLFSINKDYKILSVGTFMGDKGSCLVSIESNTVNKPIVITLKVPCPYLNSRFKWSLRAEGYKPFVKPSIKTKLN